MGESFQSEVAICYLINVAIFFVMNVPIYLWKTETNWFRHVQTAYYFIGLPASITSATVCWLI